MIRARIDVGTGGTIRGSGDLRSNRFIRGSGNLNERSCSVQVVRFALIKFVK